MADAALDVLSGDRQVVVLDVEATCWKNNVWSKRKETIELGAIRYVRNCPEDQWPEFQTFVRPTKIPRLSEFCKQLTKISQEDVDAAPLFPAALHAFLEWAQPIDRLILATWSMYDLWQLDLDLDHFKLPKLKLPHLDLKKLSTRIIGGKSFEASARTLDIEVEGRHRAISDARVAARILDRLLRPAQSRQR